MWRHRCWWLRDDNVGALDHHAAGGEVEVNDSVDLTGGNLTMVVLNVVVAIMTVPVMMVVSVKVTVVAERVRTTRPYRMVVPVT